MTVDCNNVLSNGIVGLRTKILESSDSTLEGMAGMIVFETKNTIFIRKDSIMKQVAKKAAKSSSFKPLLAFAL